MDLALGIIIMLVAVGVGVAVSKRAHPAVTAGWRWLASHLAFAIVLYWGLNYFGIANVDIYVKPL